MLPRSLCLFFFFFFFFFFFTVACSLAQLSGEEPGQLLFNAVSVFCRLSLYSFSQDHLPTSCYSKPVWLTLFCREKFWRMSTFPTQWKQHWPGDKKAPKLAFCPVFADQVYIYEANENQWHLVLLTPNLVGGVLMPIWNVVGACTAHALWAIWLCFWSLFQNFFN